MVLVLATILYPHKVANEVAKKYIEMVKKYPADPSLGEMLTLGTRATLEGIKVVSIGSIAKGKVEEALSNLATQYQEYTSIEGFKWQVEMLMDMAEAYKAVGMTAPEV